MLSFLLVAAAYLLGAFYLQRPKIVGRPSGIGKKYAVSMILYIIPFLVTILILSDSLLTAVLFLLTVLATHLIYFTGCGRNIPSERGGLPVFACAHTANVILLFLCAYVIDSESMLYSRVTDLLSSLFGNSADLYLYLLLSVLICVAPASELVRRTMDHFCPEAASCDRKDDSDGLGATIGVYERIIILILGFMGWYVAIAFVITAKSIARFKQFEDRRFVERFMIGTFTSILIPIVLLFIMEQIF
ncbi:MAG: hypothetical protein FWH44_01720 [Methanomassiliicoccaceae archaeon]|nr:hypothetical protein [Methanomassiliicoccaceae archaeon]